MLMPLSPTSYKWQGLKLRHFVNLTRLAGRSNNLVKMRTGGAKCKCKLQKLRKSCFSLTRNCGSESKRRKLCHSGFQIAQNRTLPMQNISAKLFPSSHPCSTITLALRSLCVFLTKDSFSVDISLFRRQFLFPLLFPLPP